MYLNTYCSQCGQDFGPGRHGFSHCRDHERRDYLKEARAILAVGESYLLPEWQHLRALDDHYQSELIRIAHELQQLMEVFLRRN